SAERTVRARTRPVPKATADAKLTRVTPETFAAAVAAAQLGEVLFLQPGQYGTLTISRDGAPGKPIVIRGTDGVVFERIILRGRKYVYLENLTVKEKTQGYAG